MRESRVWLGLGEWSLHGGQGLAFWRNGALVGEMFLNLV